jgi:hydroxyacylglutathione hydrolase
VEVTRVGALRVEREAFGEHFTTNCYVVLPDAGVEALVVDPGQGAGPWVEERLRAHDRRLGAVLVTHGHMDHTWDVWPLVERNPAPVVVHAADRPYLERPQDALPGHFPAALLVGHPGRLPSDCREVTEGQMTLAGVQVEALHTPGHTPGSTSYAIGPGPAFVATGDTVLASGPGPVFGPVGDAGRHATSLVALQGVLDDAAVLLPGHGPIVWLRQPNNVLTHDRGL